MINSFESVPVEGALYMTLVLCNLALYVVVDITPIIEHDTVSAGVVDL